MHARTALLAAAALAAVTLTACSSGGSSNPPIGGNYPVYGPPSSYQCDPGTQVQLANPQPYQTGVPTNQSSITIVANGDNNVLYQTYDEWELLYTDAYSGSTYATSTLQLVPDQNGPHPYGSDYYYSGSLNGQGFIPGDSYTVSLVQAQNGCQPVTVGSFST